MKVLKCFLFGAAVLGVCVLMHFYGDKGNAGRYRKRSNSSSCRGKQ